jgi:hypothetical protein
MKSRERRECRTQHRGSEIIAIETEEVNKKVFVLTEHVEKLNIS